MATGAVRYGFSGPTRDDWAVAFLPDGSAFLAPRIFEQGLNVWPTVAPKDPGATKDLGPEAVPAEPAPPDAQALEGVDGRIGEVEMASTGMLAFQTADARVVLRPKEGPAPVLAAVPGEGPITLRFTPDGGTLAALRAGRLYAWTPKR